MMETEFEMLQLQVKEHQSLPANTKARKEKQETILSQVSEGALALLTSLFWTSNFQNWDNNKFL